MDASLRYSQACSKLVRVNRPAAAVIPAPIAYIKVAAVKKLVVGFLTKLLAGPPRQCVSAGLAFVIRSNDMRAALHWVGAACFRSFTLKKLECFKQAFLL